MTVFFLMVISFLCLGTVLFVLTIIERCALIFVILSWLFSYPDLFLVIHHWRSSYKMFRKNLFENYLKYWWISFIGLIIISYLSHGWASFYSELSFLRSHGFRFSFGKYNNNNSEHFIITKIIYLNGKLSSTDLKIKMNTR